MKKIILLVLASMLVFASCKKDPVTIDDNPPIDNTRNFVNVTTSVAGLVVDANNAPVADATVSFGTETSTTDANGIFKFEDVTVLENRAFIKVEKAGYFHGSRTFFAYANQRSNVKISLLEKTIQGSFTPNGGTVTTPEGVKLIFPANAVADADGNPYMGTVQVAAQYLDPTADNISSIMPGDLRGITTDNVEEGLTTYGMVAVELLGSGGELLNVADGKTVELTMPVANAQISSAPAEIPLWYFDEINGVWKEEGKATLQGNKYVGEVSHFTYWNCDTNWDLIYLDGSILLDGINLEGAHVCLTIVTNGWGSTACDVTNSSGIFSGQVPTNTTFTLNVYPGGYSNCGDVIHTQEIGPFTADVTLDAIDIDPSTVADNSITVIGTMVDCDNNPVTNGYAKIKIGGAQYFAYSNNGIIDYTFTHCGSSTDVEIAVVDLDDLVQSDPVTYPWANFIDIGTSQACSNQAEFLTYEYDGFTNTITQYVYLYDSLGQGIGMQNIAGENNQGYISFNTEGNAVGTFGGAYLNVSGTPTNPNGGGSGNDISVTFTQYSGALGGVCEGTFTGDITTSTGTTTITGSFRVIREL